MTWPSFVVVGLGIALLSSCDPPIGAVVDVFETGTTPNSVALARCGGDPGGDPGGERVALVTASGGGRLQALFVDDVVAAGSTPRSTSVAYDDGDVPWAVAALDDDRADDRAVVTLQGAGAMSLADPCQGVAQGRFVPAEIVDIDPLELRRPIDSDGDGRADTTVTRMLPRAPQPVVVVGGRVFVAFTNVFEPAFAGVGDMIAARGVVAEVRVDGDALLFERQVLVDCENPQGLAVGVLDGVTRLVVSCTGRFAVDAAGLTRASDGGLVVLDVDDLATVHAQRFAMSFGTPAVVDDGAGGEIVVGDVLGGRLRRFSSALALLEEIEIGDDNESIFKVVVVDGRPAAVRFLQQDLLIDPFGTPRSLSFVLAGDTAQTPSSGLLDVAIDEDAGDAFGLLTLSAQLVRVDLGASE